MIGENQKDNLAIDQTLSLENIIIHPAGSGRLARHQKLKKTKKRAEKATLLFITYLGSFLGISLIALLNEHLGSALDLMFLIGSFGATAVIVFALPDSHLANPKNVIIGHFISSIIGVTAFHLFNDTIWLASALAVSTSILLMQITNTIHPPAGASALIAVIGSEKIHKLGYLYSVAPVATGATTLVLVAYVTNSVYKNKKNPFRKFIKNTIKKFISL